MEVDCNPKLARVLKKLLDPNFKVRNDVYLNKLLKHITEKQSDGDGDSANNRPFLNATYFMQWIKAVIVRCGEPKPPPPCLLPFALHMTKFMCSDEGVFVKLNGENVFERLMNTIAKAEPSASLKMAYVELLCSFLCHKSGLQWIISTNNWNEVFSLVLLAPTVYIRKSGCKFIATLIEKSVEMNEKFCFNAIQLMLAPVGVTNIGQSYHEDTLPTLQIIYLVLECLLGIMINEESISVISKVIRMFNIEKQLQQIILGNNIDLLFESSKILQITWLINFVIKHGFQKGPVTYAKIEQEIRGCWDILCLLVERGSTRQILTFLTNSLRNWKQISNIMPICINIDQEPLFYEHQMSLLQLFPVVMVSLHLIKSNADELAKDDAIRDLFYTKCIKKGLPDTFRVAFAWRNLLLRKNAFIDGTLALKYVMQSKCYYSRDVGNTAFQCLLYSLKDVTDMMKNGDVLLPLSSEVVDFTSLMLTGIVSLIKDFNLSWKDSVETVGVLEVSFNCLDIPCLPPKLVVNGLSLVDVAISKYMSPNMALLIDKVHDSIMGLLGPMLFTKLHDGSWEVRDSALEVICTISHIANQKFPSYRKVILDSDFPSVVIRMATQDGEPFVRATAWKCLREMIQVKEFWGKLCENEQISEQLLRVLHTETEGIVRKEAAAAMSTIYEHHDIAEDVLGKLYDIMTHCVLVDLYWEVKVNALNFWSKVIDRHLTNQGMIDGTFPTVTFSKENRKIVMLTEAEVRKRLVKVLNQLSETGCLAVFAAALQDDCDSEVSSASLELVRNFVEMLKKYNVTENIVTVSTPPSPLEAFCSSPYQPLRRMSASTTSSTGLSDNVMNCTEIPSTAMDSDTVLEGLLDIQDIKLLEAVFNPSNQPTDDYVHIKGKQVMKPADFLKFVYSDLEASLSDKRRWLKDIDDFDSLLDDILREYNVGDVNSMDCY